MKKYIWPLVLAVLFLALSFVGGCQYHKKLHPCPTASIDTISVHDTTIHYIVDTVPFYIIRRDSIIKYVEVPANVDTMAILADYFALHYYTREWSDSLLYAKSEDVIAENQFIDNVFTYKIKRPAQVIYNSIDNSVAYTRYLNLGVSLPISKMEYAEFEAYYVFRRGHIGAGYIPSLKSPSFKIGLNVVKIK